MSESVSMSSEQVNLSLFTHLLSRPDDEIDLFEAALMISTIAYPEVDPAVWKARLDDLGDAVREAVVSTPGAGSSGPVVQMKMLLEVLYRQLGFRGNEESYFEPENSFMSDVLKRRVGIPISLALVVIEVAARAKIPAVGVSFPGHFLVRCDESNGFAMIDPFHGAVLEVSTVNGLYQRATGQTGSVPPSALQPAGPRVFLLRMLNNLASIYRSRDDAALLEATQRRIKIVEASASQRSSASRIARSPRSMN
ncbi:MAG: transglutaminase-like domain-containing protein [Polyangiaceae bacterium]